MARLLLNTRASRITIVDNILLLPAEVKKDEQLGKVIKPSRTLISQRRINPDVPSPYERVQRCKQTRALIDAGILRWSDEKVSEPDDDEPATQPAAPAQKQSDAAVPEQAAKTKAEGGKAGKKGSAADGTGAAASEASSSAAAPAAAGG